LWLNSTDRPAWLCFVALAACSHAKPAPTPPVIARRSSLLMTSTFLDLGPLVFLAFLYLLNITFLYTTVPFLASTRTPMCCCNPTREHEQHCTPLALGRPAATARCRCRCTPPARMRRWMMRRGSSRPVRPPPLPASTRPLPLPHSPPPSSASLPSLPLPSLPPSFLEHQ
jgi:hypothetical protein